MSCAWPLLRMQARSRLQSGERGMFIFRRRRRPRLHTISMNCDPPMALTIQATCYLTGRCFTSASSDVKITVNKDTNEREAMQTKTDQILERTPGTMSPPQWAMAERVLFGWIQNQNDDGMKMAWKLMDRLVHEQELDTTTKRVTTQWLVRLIQAWRQQARIRGTESPSPEEVLGKISDYEACGVLPDARVYSILVDTSTKTATNREAAAQFAQDVLNRMKLESKVNPAATPDSFVYINVMDAWAQSGAPYQAEALLREMVEADLLHENDTSCIVALTTMLKAWANSGLPRATERVEASLNLMEKRSIKLEKACYAVVIGAFAKAGNGAKAESVLKRLQSRYQETRDERIKPTNREYNSVISAYANEGNAAKAEAVLRRMQHMQDIEPDTISFNAVIAALGNKLHDSSAVEKAESLLQEMQQLYMEGNENVKPNVVTFSSVINLLSKSDNVYAPQKAERILRRMQKDFQDGKSDVKPNTFAFSSAINAWTRSRAPKAAQRAESLLRWMLELSKAGDDDVKPNTVVYSAVISAWSKSRSPKAAEKAEALLREMQDLYEAGDVEVKPNTVTFTSVISAFANSREKNAAKKAEEFLGEMQQLYQRGDVDVKPNIISFNSVISTYSNNRDPTAGHHALKQLERMKQLYKDGDEDCRPNIVTYNTVISALSSSGKEEDVQTGYDLLAEAHALADKGDRNVRPNSRTYTSLLKAVASSEFPNKAEKALGLLEEMKQRSIEPTIFVLDEVLHCCSFIPKDKEQQDLVFRVARETLELVHISTKLKARPFTYVYYFRACNNLRDDADRTAALKFGYEQCQKDGLENNSQVKRALSEITGP